MYNKTIMSLAIFFFTTTLGFAGETLINPCATLKGTWKGVVYLESQQEKPIVMHIASIKAVSDQLYEITGDINNVSIIKQVNCISYPDKKSIASVSFTTFNTEELKNNYHLYTSRFGGSSMKPNVIYLDSSEKSFIGFGDDIDIIIQGELVKDSA